MPKAAQWPIERNGCVKTAIWFYYYISWQSKQGDKPDVQASNMTWALLSITFIVSVFHALTVFSHIKTDFTHK